MKLIIRAASYEFHQQEKKHENLLELSSLEPSIRVNEQQNRMRFKVLPGKRKPAVPF